jgi:hypothetical protein
MRTTLRISICSNCALLGCLAFLLLHGRWARRQAKSPAEAETLPPVAEGIMPAPATSPIAEVKPFHWSQIESADYLTYISNLREVGCPEQAIRVLVTADMDNLYAARRKPLEEKLVASSLGGRLAAEGGLRELRNEEAAAVTALLVTPPGAANTISALAAETPPSGSVRQEPPDTALTSQAIQNVDPSGRELEKTASDVAPGPPPSHSVRQEPPATISLPLVFHEVDPSVLTLNPQQAQVVNDLRQKFIAEVGGPNQDPNDPAYSQRWQTSQPAVDLDLWSTLGINAFQAYQIAAWTKAHDQTPPGP